MRFSNWFCRRKICNTRFFDLPFLLEFDLKYEYDTLEEGITIPAVLRLTGKTAYCDAKVDPGAQVCVFQREVGEAIGIDVESGNRIKLGSLGGPVIAFGHWVTLNTFDWEFDSLVYFARDYNLPRNLLGREGWLQKTRLAVVDYEAELYLSPYGNDAVT